LRPGRREEVWKVEVKVVVGLRARRGVIVERMVVRKDIFACVNLVAFSVYIN
jgi:hypothetical protein